MAEPSRIEQIEAVINSLISRVEAEPVTGSRPLVYAEVLDVEVPPVKFPASTLLFSYPSQADAATGGVTENRWRWIQRSYWDYTDPELAQKEMKRMLPALLAQIRSAEIDDLIFPDGTPFVLEIDDAGDPDRARVGEQQMLIKSLFLTATTEEF